MQIAGGWLREGSILCPPCEEICSAGAWTVEALHAEQLTSSLETDQTPTINKCLPDVEPPFEVGDPLLDVPCAAYRSEVRTSRVVTTVICIIFILA